jgi:hypothetical protein
MVERCVATTGRKLLSPVIEFDFRMVASLDRKRLGTKVSRKTSWTRGVFDEEASRKPLAFAADAVSYGI